MLEVGTIRDSIQEHLEEEDNKDTAVEVVEQRIVMMIGLEEVMEQVIMDTMEERVIIVLSTPAILRPTATVEDNQEEVHLLEDMEEEVKEEDMEEEVKEQDTEEVMEVRDTLTIPTQTTVSLGPDLQSQEVVQEVQEVH